MVSVIMLTYNRAKVVSGMINDILGQTYNNIEFVIVNNGSDDDTDQILKKFSASDDRVKIITIPASSIGRARNIGLKNSKGDRIAYVDDDDRVDSDFLEFLVNLMNEFDADISMCGASQGDGFTRDPQCLFDEKYVLDGEEAVRALIGRRYIRNGTATKLYKREVLEKFPFVENYRNEDLHTQYKYLLASRVVAIYGIEKYYITRHEGNVSGFTGDASKWDARTIRDYYEAYHNRAEYLIENAPNLARLAQYSEWSFMISMVDKIQKYNLQDCKELQKEFVEELGRHKNEFLEMQEIQDFERKWVDDYIKNAS